MVSFSTAGVHSPPVYFLVQAGSHLMRSHMCLYLKQHKLVLGLPELNFCEQAHCPSKRQLQSHIQKVQPRISISIHTILVTPHGTQIASSQAQQDRDACQREQAGNNGTKITTEGRKSNDSNSKIIANNAMRCLSALQGLSHLLASDLDPSNM